MYTDRARATVFRLVCLQSLFVKVILWLAQRSHSPVQRPWQCESESVKIHTGAQGHSVS